MPNNYGGSRPGSGRKSREETKTVSIRIKISTIKELKTASEAVSKRLTTFIRECAVEKAKKILNKT